jgi:cytochrome b561
MSTAIPLVTPAPVRTQFTSPMRILHWLMVIMILSMLCIGVAMVASIGWYHTLLAIHRPLGMAIFIVAAVRLAVRVFSPLPPFPPTVPPQEQKIAAASEYLMYTLMFAMPLIGWGMLSAARYPVTMVGSLQLPYILPHSPKLYWILRKTHTVLAYLFFLTFMGHFSAVLFHTIVLRDGLLLRMVPWKVRPRSEIAQAGVTV